MIATLEEKRKKKERERERERGLNEGWWWRTKVVGGGKSNFLFNSKLRVYQHNYLSLSLSLSLSFHNFIHSDAEMLSKPSSAMPTFPSSSEVCLLFSLTFSFLSLHFTNVGELNTKISPLFFFWNSGLCWILRKNKRLWMAETFFIFFLIVIERRKKNNFWSPLACCSLFLHHIWWVIWRYFDFGLCWKLFYTPWS